MPIISQQSLDLLVALINQDNPDLPVALTDTNVKYGTPTIVVPTGGAIQNTSLKLTAKNTSAYIGNTVVQYRRIDLGTLFRAIPIVINTFSPASAGSSPFNISGLLGLINSKYGLSLTTADIVDGALPAGNTNAVPAIGLAAGTRNSSITVNANATSYGYVGSFTLYWVQAPEDISTMIGTTSLETARVYPGNLETVSSGLYVPDLDVFSFDFTDAFNAAATAEGMALGTWINDLCAVTLGTSAAPYNAIQAQLIAAIQSVAGKTYNMTNPATTAMSLFGAQLTQVVLPATTLPEADSTYFDRAVYLTLPAANTWGAGRMIFHYNV